MFYDILQQPNFERPTGAMLQGNYSRHDSRLGLGWFSIGK
jgi:hypothetical protein